jgi:hypothetical protein
MNFLSRSVASILVALCLLLLTLPRTLACGPSSRYAIFSYSKHPDFPLDRYSAGDLGVLQTSYARSYLYAAYRAMNGMNFEKEERDALSSLWNQRLNTIDAAEAGDSKPLWIDARAKVPGIGPAPNLLDYRGAGKDKYDSFLNCHPDAFKTAAKTLEERLAKFGAASTEVKEWTVAQDQVFANCGGGESIPASTTSSDPTIKADRSYQIAAAHFYAMNYDDARTQFERIAEDNTSEWRDQAQYLVARSLIRKASLGDSTTRQESLTQAVTVLKKVLAENKNGSNYESARGLLGLTELRLHPELRLRELARSLIETRPNGNLKQELWDYTVLLDRYLGDSDQPLDEDLKAALDAGAKDDLTEWLVVFQSTESTAFARAFENWERKRSTPWLIACLSKLDAKNAKMATVVADAERIDSKSPAFATAQFHLVRLSIESGDRAGARKKLDNLLQGKIALPASTANQFRHQRMTLASDLNDFLKFAVRQPAAFSWDDDAIERPIELKDDEDLKPWAGRALLDVDSTTLLNERFPLAMLREAASNNDLPEHIRKKIALAVWTRAVVLDDVDTGKEIVPLAMLLAPELKLHLNEYLSATNREARQSAGLYAILKFPGLRPFIDSSMGRLTPIGERDTYRDNWWCEPSAGTGAASESSEEPRPIIAAISLEFINNTQAAIAKREYAKLVSLGSAPNYLSREAIAWATRAPKDPRIPEALHLAVVSTRYGCTDKETAKWSKAAFDLLHKRYPQSSWAKKTPYWFKEG